MAIRWPQGARELVDSLPVARLATADSRGVPHVIPICYVRRSTRIYSVIDDKPKRSRTGLKRLRNIAVNPAVAVIFDRYHPDWSKLAYVLVRGVASQVESRPTFSDALRRLREKYPAYRRMDLAFESHPMLCVQIERVRYWSAHLRSS